VLTDGTERARYDRLGHESYLRLAEHGTEAADEPRTDSDRTADSEESTSRSTADRREKRSGGGNRSTGRTRKAHSRGASRSTTHHQGSTGGQSHHARQRARRQRRTASQRATGEWSTNGSHAGAARQRSQGTATRHHAAGAERESESETGFRYDVHNWEGEIELDPDSQRLGEPTIASLGAVTVLYPLLIYASLTPVFSLLTNAIVAACTLTLIGYMLTVPRIAIVTFGGWSVLVPLFFLATPFDPLSLYAVVAIGCCWVPLGFAFGIRWALQP